jgi:hypothetical protein
MSATPATEAIVNPTLVGVSAGGAAEGAWTRSGGRLVKTYLFRVSSNRDTVPRRTRLPRTAAGNTVAEAIAHEVISAKATEQATPKRHRAGPSARKRKEVRTTAVVPDRVNEVADGGPAPAACNEELVGEVAEGRPAPAAGNEELNREPAAVQEDGVYDAGDDVHTTTPEVSEDEGPAEESDDDSVDNVTPRQASQTARGGAPGPPPAAAQREPSSPENSEDDEGHALTDLGVLNHDPVSVGFLFTQQAGRERRAGLDVASQVWATTRHLLGGSTTASK